MDARAKTVGDILQTGTVQYLVPFFQRHYKWGVPNWTQLWEDMERLAEQSDTDRHFMGSMVCTPHNPMPGEVAKYQLIDGQQRLTTLTILLVAIREKALECELPKIAEQIQESYLIHKYQSGNDCFRLLPRTGDRGILFAAIDNTRSMPKGQSRIKKALKYFTEKLSEKLEEVEDLEVALKKLLLLVANRLLLVVITIDNENPYDIFHSLNATGLPLQQSDLIRNYIFMQVPLEKQEYFNSSCWDEVEELLGETNSKKAAKDATKFYRHYLMCTGEYIQRQSVFVAFQSYYKKFEYTPESVAIDIASHASIYDTLLSPAESDAPAEVKAALVRLQQLDQTTTFPLLMYLYSRFEGDTLPAKEYAECIDLITGYILRRSICGESSRSYDRLFVELIPILGQSPFDDLKKYFLEHQWPDDQAFVPALVEFDLYRRSPRAALLMLSEVELALDPKEVIDKQGITIEHVLPQTIDSGSPGKEWQHMLGDDWQEKHKQHLGTLGNLTLTGHNSKISNHGFAKKKEYYANGKFKLYDHFAKVDTWDVDAIVERGTELAKKVAEIWPRPEGKPYVPTADLAKEEKKLQDHFWKTFREGWLITHPDYARSSRFKEWELSFNSGHRRFRYFATIEHEEDAVMVGVYFNRRKHIEWMGALWNDIPESLIDEINAHLGTECDYEEGTAKNGEYSYIWFAKTGLDLSQERNWPEIFSFFTKGLATLKDKLQTYIENADPYAEYDEEDYELLVDGEEESEYEESEAEIETPDE